MKQKIINLLRELDFGENETRVYLALTELGESTAAIIAKKAGLPRTTAISILDNLEKKNYLTTHQYKHRIYYWIESPKTIRDRLLDRVSIAEELDSYLSKLYRAESDFPFGQIIDTKSGIKTFIERTLHAVPKRGIIYTIDTPHIGNYDKVLSNEYSRVLLEVKKKRQIVTRTLVPYGAFATIAPEKIRNQTIIIRELPKEINFKASLWLLDKLLVLFSGQSPFIAVVKHTLIVDSFRSLYDFLWHSAAPKWPEK